MKKTYIAPVTTQEMVDVAYSVMLTISGSKALHDDDYTLDSDDDGDALVKQQDVWENVW